jgi:aminoglycoside phosphotransferase (APT) family kinase protein
VNTPFERLVQKFEPGSTLLQSHTLTGGVSAQVTMLELQRPSGEVHRLIVRRHGPIDLRQNPKIAVQEFRLLQLLQIAGIPAPIPYYLDDSGEIFPTPYLVLQYIDGQPEFAPTNLDDFLLQLATHLATIHRLAPIATARPRPFSDQEHSPLPLCGG